MRLWHEALIPYLSRQHLLGQHREVCALRGKGWGRKHATVDYVFTHPKEWLWAYHMKVIGEMLNRGYHPDISWFDIHYQGKELPLRADDEINVEEINNKLAETEIYIYPEHDDVYLEECLNNLESKGYDDIRRALNEHSNKTF